MEKCVACGKLAWLPSDLEDTIICKTCASKINFSMWKKRNFKTIEELVTQKNDAIQLANVNGFPDKAIKTVEEYFDSYINAGYVTMIDGEAGQILKIFANYCIIETKSDIKKSELVEAFCRFLENNVDTGIDNGESFLSGDNGKTLVKGLLSGRIVQTGIGVAAASYFDAKEKESATEKKSQNRRKRVEQLVTVGEHKVNLQKIAEVDIYSASDATNGYIRFIPKGISPHDYYSCDYFFFSGTKLFGAKKFKQSINSICDMLNNKIFELEKSSNEVKTSSAKDQDVFEELRRFKELYDDGIITEKEFNAKKKQLLKL